MAARTAPRPANQVWIGNVPGNFREEDVIQSFTQHNLARPIYVDIRRGTRDENYAFGYFATQAEADAILALPQYTIRFPEGRRALIKVVVFFFVLCAGMLMSTREGQFGPTL